MSSPTRRRILTACALALALTALSPSARAEPITEIRGSYAQAPHFFLDITDPPLLLIQFMTGTISSTFDQFGNKVPTPLIGEAVNDLGSFSPFPYVQAFNFDNSPAPPPIPEFPANAINFLTIACPPTSPIPIAFLFPDAFADPNAAAFLQFDPEDLGPNSIRIIQTGGTLFLHSWLTFTDICPGVDLSPFQFGVTLIIDVQGFFLTDSGLVALGAGGGGSGGATFRLIAVPEPASLTLCLIAAAGMGVGWARRRYQSLPRTWPSPGLQASHQV